MHFPIIVSISISASRLVVVFNNNSFGAIFRLYFFIKCDGSSCFLQNHTTTAICLVPLRVPTKQKPDNYYNFKVVIMYILYSGTIVPPYNRLNTHKVKQALNDAIRIIICFFNGWKIKSLELSWSLVFKTATHLSKEEDNNKQLNEKGSSGISSEIRWCFCLQSYIRSVLVRARQIEEQSLGWSVEKTYVSHTFKESEY